MLYSMQHKIYSSHLELGFNSLTNSIHLFKQRKIRVNTFNICIKF